MDSLNIIRGSKLHQAVVRMASGPSSLAELKKDIGYNQPMEMFHLEIVNVLTNGGYVTRRNQQYFITPKGAEAADYLGRVKRHIPKISHKNENEPYTGKEIRRSIERPGADDHFRWPSRRGDRLFYRDGRVENI